MRVHLIVILIDHMHVELSKAFNFTVISVETFRKTLHESMQAAPCRKS